MKSSVCGLTLIYVKKCANMKLNRSVNSQEHGWEVSGELEIRSDHPDMHYHTEIQKLKSL